MNPFLNSRQTTKMTHQAIWTQKANRSIDLSNSEPQQLQQSRDTHEKLNKLKQDQNHGCKKQNKH